MVVNDDIAVFGVSRRRPRFLPRASPISPPGVLRQVLACGDDPGCAWAICVSTCGEGGWDKARRLGLDSSGSFWIGGATNKGLGTRGGAALCPRRRQMRRIRLPKSLRALSAQSSQMLVLLIRARGRIVAGKRKRCMVINFVNCQF